MGQQPPAWFRHTASALAYSVGHKNAAGNAAACSPPYNDLAEFILLQWRQLPDYLRLPMLVATLGYDFVGLLKRGRLFHALPPEARRAILEASKGSGLGAERDLIRYHESLATLALHSRAPEEMPVSPATDPETAQGMPVSELRCQFAVIGSGPSGAISACLLAEAGRDVLLIEEGALHPPDVPTPFTKSEMLHKYRNGGQTVALGRDKIAYVEGRCVGGGSEINSGLYHRTPPEILERWRRQFEVQALSEADMGRHFEACEHDVSVSLLPGPAPAASLKMHEGSRRLGWKSLEVPRWFRYATEPQGGGLRQSMTRTYIPRFTSAGGRLLAGGRALGLRRTGNSWEIRIERQSGQRTRVQAEHVILCAGAVQTPALLHRSGIKRLIGESLALHPTVKVVAKFKQVVNSADMGVPVHQVKEFSPGLSFGCSISSMPYVALGLLDHPAEPPLTLEAWRYMANYYAMLSPKGRGAVSVIPGFRDPLVRFRLTEEDRRMLADGLHKLCALLLEAGAERLLPSVRGIRKVTSATDLRLLPEAFTAGSASLMTIHLFSSCPMGENRALCPVDSFGLLRAAPKLSIHDASLLCGPPGVNPQGTIMALARRNTMRLLGKA
jgi:choline dehydrogenase-like flavoprotein